MSSLDSFVQITDLVAAFGGGGSGSGGGGSVGGGGFSDSGGSSGSGDGEWPFGWRGTLLIALGIVALACWNRYRGDAAVTRAPRQRGAGGLDVGETMEERLWASLEAGAPGWTEETTEAYVREAVLALNDAWSRLDTDAMRPWLTPRMHDKMSAMVETLRMLGRRNVDEQVDVQSLALTGLPKDPSASGSGFTIYVGADAQERLVDEHASRQLLQAKARLDERWTFVSDGSRWLLDHIHQVTGSVRHVDPSIQAFAERQGLHYSADMGRMFLPDDGVLFDEASLQSSDVNNHVIGWVDGRVVQLFTYEPRPDGDPTDDTVVAQGVLPRAVGDILVRPRRRGRVPKGLRRLSFESARFDERWDVFATEADEISAFELLHPAFLERLAELPFDVGIEAVGRCLYLFVEDRAATHEQLFDLLRRAYVELER